MSKTLKETNSNDNIYTFFCDETERMERFYVCLKLIQRFTKEGKLVSRKPCEKAIKCKKCPAMIMRLEEIKAKKGIYFTERPDIPGMPAPSTRIDVTSYGYDRGFHARGFTLGQQPKQKAVIKDDDWWDADKNPVSRKKVSTKVTPKKSEPKKKTTDDLLSGGIADAINNALEEKRA